MTPFNAMRLRKTAGAGGAPLDAYTANVWSAYGVQKLFSTATNAFRVRRSSDDAEADIPFSGSGYDVAAYDAHVGSDDGFLVTAYDQTGSGNHWSQSTTTRQPRLSAAGVHDGFLRFDGTDDRIVTANNFPAGGHFVMFTRMKARSVAAYFQIVANTNVATGANNGLSIQNGSSSIVKVFMFFNGAAQILELDFSNTPLLTEAVHTFRLRRDGTLNEEWRVNNTAQTGTPVGGSTLSGSFSADTLYMAGDPGGGAGQLDIKTCVIYSSHKDADRAAISSAM